MLDNDFRNPDLERYVERFHDVEPRVGVIGDADTVEEAREYVDEVDDASIRRDALAILERTLAELPSSNVQSESPREP